MKTVGDPAPAGGVLDGSWIGCCCTGCAETSREEQPAADSNAAHKTATKKKIADFLFISTSIFIRKFANSVCFQKLKIANKPIISHFFNNAHYYMGRVF